MLIQDPNLSFMYILTKHIYSALVKYGQLINVIVSFIFHIIVWAVHEHVLFFVLLMFLISSRINFRVIRKSHPQRCLAILLHTKEAQISPILM